MKVLYFLITTCFLFFANIYTENSAENPYAPNENTVKIDISKAIKDTESFLSKLKITKVVKLKGEDKTFITNSRKIIEHKELIYILDFMQTELTIFDKQGNYVGRVGAKGRGPGEFERIFDFTILDDDKIIVAHMNGLSMFDKNRQYIKSKNNLHPSQISKIKGNEFTAYLEYPTDPKFSKNLIAYNSNFDFVDDFFPFPKDNLKHFLDVGGVKSSPYGILFNETSSPVLHELTKDRVISAKYMLSGSDNIWPYKNRYDLIAFSKKIMEYNNNIIHLNSSFQESTTALVLSMKHKNKFRTVFFDKQEEKVYLPSLLNQSHMFPLFLAFDGLALSEKNEFIIPVYMNKLYRKLNKDETLKTDMAKYFPELLTLAEGTDEYSNPALVYFTFGE